VVPFGTVLGNRAKLAGLNVIGLRRRGYDRAAIRAIRAAYRELFWSSGVFAERLEAVRCRFGAEPLVAEALAFIDAPSRRGLVRSGQLADDEGDA
jgi:UDP-N-acetylglucosamine acyltransferase